MSWSYSGNPSSSSRDKVRFLIGDTDSTDQLLTDAEVDYTLTVYTDAYLAGAMCSDVLAAKWSRLADKSVGSLSISYSQRQKNMAELAQRLRRMSATLSSTVAPYAGGISVSDKESQEEDDDRTAPAFSVGMHDAVEPPSKLSED